MPDMLDAALACAGAFLLLPPAAYVAVSLLIMAGHQPTAAWTLIFLAIWLATAALTAAFTLVELRRWARARRDGCCRACNDSGIDG